MNSNVQNNNRSGIEKTEQQVFDTNHLSRTYLKLALPVALGMIITLLYNLADTFFIAQTGDTDLVAGVSLCAPIFTALMAFGNIYGQGGSSLISRLLGSENREETRKVSSFCFYIAIVTGFILGVLMLLFRNPLLILLGANKETLPYAESYFIVMAAGSPFVVLSFIHMNFVRCEGMAVQSMVGGMLGSIVNIILDPIMISLLKMGAAGAAVATVLGYVCTVVFFLILLSRRNRRSGLTSSGTPSDRVPSSMGPVLSVRMSDCHVDKGKLGQILGVGVTAALANLMQSLSVIVLNHYLLPYGNTQIAAMGIAMKVNLIAQLIITGLAFGGVPLFGYLYGASLENEMKRLIRFCIFFLGSLALLLTVLLYVFASPLIHGFMDHPSIIKDGTLMLRWLSAGTVFSSLVLLFTVLFQATGQVLSAFLMSVSRQGIIFLAAIAVGEALFGYIGILAAQAAADVFSAILAVFLYQRFIRTIIPT